MCIRDSTYTIVDGIEGRGQFVGVTLATGMNGNNTCWVEGEARMYLDDDPYPSIHYTGTEDYFEMCIRDRDTRTSPDREEVYPLSGVVTCGGCGIPMVRKTSKVGGKTYAYYLLSLIHISIVLSSVLPAYGMFHSIQILFL